MFDFFKAHIIQGISLTLLLLMLCGCFLIDKDLFNGIVSTKYMWLQLTSIGVIVFVIVKCFLVREVKVHVADILVLLLVFFAVGREWFSEMSHSNFQFYFTQIIMYFGLYLFCRSLTSHTTILITVLIIYLSIVSAQAVLGLLQLYGHFSSHHSIFKITGSFHNPGPFSGYIVSGVPIALGLYHITKQKIIKPIVLDDSSQNNFRNWKNAICSYVKALNYKILVSYYSQFVLFLLLITLSATHSRAAWLGAIVSCLYVVYKLNLGFVKVWIQQLELLRKSTSKKVFIIGSISVVIAALLFGLYKFKEGSANGRLLMWQVSFEMIKEKPILGWGAGGFEAKYSDFQADWFRSGKGSKAQEMVAGNPDAPFNEVIRIAISYGAVGLLLSIILTVLVFKTIKTSKEAELKKNIQFILSGALVSIFIFSLFSYTFDIAPMVLQLILFIGILVGIQKDGIIILSPKVKEVHKLVLIRLLGVGLLVLLPLLVQNTWKQYKGLNHWKEAYELYQFQIYNDAVVEYEKALIHLPKNGLLLQMFGKCLLMNEKYVKAKTVLEKANQYRSDAILFTALGDTYKELGVYDKAEMAYLQAWHMIPHRFYPKYLLAKLYNESGNIQKAKQMANELMNKEVKVESKAINEMKLELKRLFEK